MIFVKNPHRISNRRFPVISRDLIGYFIRIGWVSNELIDNALLYAEIDPANTLPFCDELILQVNGLNLRAKEKKE
jgi:hypothetical protein